MSELILTFHGLGEPHHSVESSERNYWWGAAPFACLLDRIADRPSDADPKIAITFDDGNASDALIALPELAKRRLAATFFVCAGRIGKKYYLDARMIEDMLAAGMRIGSHGMYHRDWRTLDRLTMDEEVWAARKKLEDVVRGTVTEVAVPFGSYDRGVLRRLKREAWHCIYTSDGGTVRAEAKIKGRTTLQAHMQGVDILSALLVTRSKGHRAVRALSAFYRRLR